MAGLDGFINPETLDISLKAPNMAGVQTSMTYFMIGLIIVIIIAFLIYISTFNIDATIWHIANNRKVRNKDRAKKVVDKHTGATAYQFLWHKEVKLGEAPPEALELNSKGKWCIELYRLGRNQYRWRVNSLALERSEQGDKIRVFEDFLAFTDDDRRILIEQERKKAELHNLHGKDWKQNLPTIMAYSFMIVFVVIVFSFWNNIWQPLKEQQGMMLEQQKVTTEAMKTMQNLVVVARGGTPIYNQVSTVTNQTVT